MNIYMICTLWTPFQAERDWKNSNRDILQIPLLYIEYGTNIWYQYGTNIKYIFLCFNAKSNYDLIHQHFNNLKKKKLETNCPRNKYFNELRITLGLKGTDWVFGTNWNFLITIYLQPDDVNLWYSKLRLFELTQSIVWNI